MSIQKLAGTFLGLSFLIVSGILVSTSVQAFSGTDTELSLTDTSVIHFTEPENSHVYGFGETVATGDINGDGNPDLLMKGEDMVYLVYGQSTVFTSQSIDNAVQITSEYENDYIGSAISTGDINGDGYDDIVIGAPYVEGNDYHTGAVYILYGQAAQLSSQSLETAIRYYGEEIFDEAGTSVSVEGDVNNDGYNDILIGAPNAIGEDGVCGLVYLIYGQATPLSSGTLSSVIQFSGPLNEGFGVDDDAGTAVSLAGDINGDSYDDIIIGAASHSVLNPGQVYIVYGRAAQFESMSLSDAITLSGEDGSATGTAISSSGDINGDGYDDIVIGAPEGDGDGNWSGLVYLVYGQATHLTSHELNTGIRFTGPGFSENVGGTVSIVGDLNHDGYDDITIGSGTSSEAAKGRAYLLYGQAASLTSTSLNTAVTFYNAEDNYNVYVFAADDINSDGYGDLLMYDESAGTVNLIYYNLATTTETEEPPAEEEESTPSAPPSTITGDTEGYYSIITEADETIRVHGFTGYTGSKTTKVKYYAKRNLYLVYHPTFKQIIAVDGTTGEEIDRVTLYNKASTKGKIGQLVDVGKSKFLIVQTGTKSKSRVAAIRLNTIGETNVFTKFDTVTLKNTILKYGRTPRVKKVTANNFTITLKDTTGNTVPLSLKKPTGAVTLVK